MSTPSTSKRSDFAGYFTPGEGARLHVGQGLHYERLEGFERQLIEFFAASL